jgi:hypothetical protein
VRVGVDHLNGVVVAYRHQDEFSILGQLDAARPLADLDCLHSLEFVGIDHADRVAFFIRHVGGEGACLGAKQDQQARAEQAGTPHARTPDYRIHLSLHLLSGRSKPSVSSSENWC